jgi:hypothetical protein
LRAEGPAEAGDARALTLASTLAVALGIDPATLGLEELPSESP